MGCSQSYPGLTEDIIEDYASLTYLNKGEILYLMKKFYSINPDKLEADHRHRFTREEIVKKFSVFENNPFQDRLFRVFSSQNDDCFSFEDLLDVCSAMSPDCPPEVKDAWAFKIYDLDEDNQISSQDIVEIIDRLTTHPLVSAENQLDKETKMKIADVILDEIKLNYSDSIGFNEFKIIMARLPDFQSSFYFRI